MSDIQPATPSSASAGGAAPSWLIGISATVGVLVTIAGAVVTLTKEVCQLPIVSSLPYCVIPVPNPIPSPTPVPPPVPSDWEAAVEKRVAALNVVKDPKLREVNIVVWHQQPREDPLVTDVIVGLRAAGFTVRDAVTNLANVRIEGDPTPGTVWVKSIEASKDKRDKAFDAVGLVVESKRVKVSDLFIANQPTAIKAAGEVQVDVF